MNSVPPRCSRSIDSRCPNQALGRSSSRWPRPASAAGTDLSGTDRGAPGGVGSLAVQVAALRGARVLGTASTPDAAALVRRLGVAEVIDARRPEEIGRLKELAPDGLDAVLALAGGEGLEGCIDFVRANGRVAYPNGIEPEPRRRANPRLVAYDGEYGPSEFDALSQAAAESRLRVPIEATDPLDQSPGGPTRVEQGRLLGRVALRIRGEPPKARSG